MLSLAPSHSLTISYASLILFSIQICLSHITRYEENDFMCKIYTYLKQILYGTEYLRGFLSSYMCMLR